MSRPRFKAGDLVGYMPGDIDEPVIIKPALILSFKPARSWLECSLATVICEEETFTAKEYELFPFESIGKLGLIGEPTK